MSTNDALLEASENMQLGGNLTNHSLRNYFLSLAFPEQKSTAPPPFYTGMVFDSPVQGNFLRTVGDQTTKILERVRDDTFLFLWWPTLGANTMWCFGFVPRGAFSYPAPVPANIEYNMSPNTPRGMNATQPVIANILFSGALAVPFANQPGQTQMTFGIDLAENFSLVRSTSGMVSLYSDTIASGQFDLTGNVTGAVITDSRDVALTVDLDAYTASGLRSAAATKSECVFQQGIKDGVVLLAGPPQTQTFQSPEFDSRVELCGNFTTFSGTAIAAATTVASTDAAFGPVNDGFVFQWNHQYWCTPWNINVQAYPTQMTRSGMRTPADVPAAGVATLQLPAIDELGVVSFKCGVIIEPTPGYVAPSAVYPLIQTVVQATHVFAVADLDGGLNYTEVTEIKFGRICSVLGNATGPSVTTYSQENFEFNPATARGDGYGVNGKYLGTLLCTGGTVLNIDTAQSAVAGPFVTGRFVSITAIANTVNLPGACGPLRVLRVDSVGQGQTIKCQTTVNFQAVAQTNLAPFVQGAVAYSPIMTSLQGVVAAQLLFGANGRFRRVYKRSDYEAMWEEVKEMGLERLLAYAGQEPKQVAALSASGVWDAIAAGLGGLNTAMRLYGGGGEAAGQWRHHRQSGIAASADAAGVWGYDPASQIAGSGAMSSASGPWRRQRM